MQEYHKIQTEPEFEYLAHNRWIFTEKVDGTNIRIMLDPEGKITFGGKTDNASIPATLVSRLEVRFFPQRALMQEMFSEIKHKDFA